LLLIVGLGNPGKKYETTRHNVGFMFVDRLSRSSGIRCNNLASDALWGQGVIAGEEVVLLKPLTFVNLSGVPVREFTSELSLPVESVIVVYDDCDLPAGKVRIRKNGGSGGHRGVESVIMSLGSVEFPRIRLGIGRPAGGAGGGEGAGGDLRDYVLSPFDADEVDRIDEMLTRAVSAVEVLITEGLQSAMNRFNA